MLCFGIFVRTRRGTVVVSSQSSSDSYIWKIRSLWPWQWKITYAALHQEWSIHQEDCNPIHWHCCWSGNHCSRYSLHYTIILLLHIMSHTECKMLYKSGILYQPVFMPVDATLPVSYLTLCSCGSRRKHAGWLNKQRVDIGVLVYHMFCEL